MPMLYTSMPLASSFLRMPIIHSAELFSIVVQMDTASTPAWRRVARSSSLGRSVNIVPSLIPPGGFVCAAAYRNKPPPAAAIPTRKKRRLSIIKLYQKRLGDETGGRDSLYYAMLLSIVFIARIAPSVRRCEELARIG